MSVITGQGSTSDRGVALEITHLSKRFDGAVALDDVSLSVARGEIHGLLGSNGSGKSTLIKILAGFHEPEPGASVQLYGSLLPLPVSGAGARALGLAFVHQHLGLIGSLSATENLFLGKFATEDDWAIGWGAAHERAAEIFRRFDLDLDPRAEAAALSPVQQALLAIVRAYEDLRHASADHADRPGVLVLDEPTPFLPSTGVEQLFKLMRQCTDLGASVIFVSHDVDEVRDITDRATILRDGRLVDTIDTETTPHAGFVERIIGRHLESYGGQAKPLGAADVRVRVTDVTGPAVGPVSFDMKAGEIVGLAGLIGSGCDDVPALLYGARDHVSGTLEIDGTTRPLNRMTPEKALASDIAYLPADRMGEAGIGSLSIADNIAMPVLPGLQKGLGLTDRVIEAHAEKLGGEAGVRPNLPSLALAALSGGNAQKALMAKWLQVAPKLLLLDEPTQGVDVGARQQLWDALDRTAEKGTAILIGSTDYEQLARICHRVLIFASGQVIAELTGAGLSKETIAEHCYRSVTERV